jgi:hypothetical protein
MKKTLISIICTVITVMAVNAQMSMNSAGQIGMRTAPVTGNSLTVNISSGKVFFYNGAYTGLIIDNSGIGFGPAIYPASYGVGCLGKSGNAFNYIWSIGGNISISDKRQKENIRNITNALSIVSKLQGVKYDLKKEFSYNDTLIKDSKTKEKLEKGRKNNIGFLAQDVYKILPEVVVYDDSTDVYGIVYDRVVPILVEAIKEQQSQIDELTAKINSSGVKSQKEIVSMKSTEDIIPYLAQNAPNPFNQSTVIDFYIAEDSQKAMLNIYDMNGVQIKSIAISQKGKGSVTIQASELNPGMYMYSLIADGKEIDTKRMILTE